MNELSLFTGAGGGVLGTTLLGFNHVGYVEFNDYCQRILQQRIIDEILQDAPIFGDIRSFIDQGYAAEYSGMVDVVTAGFPCQPFSSAGEQKGENDEQNMWPATIEVIRQVGPRFAFLENVPRLVRFDYFGTILGDLADAGYDAEWGIVSASDIGAGHQRKRLWILAWDAHRKRWNKDSVQTRNNTEIKIFERSEFSQLLAAEKTQLPTDSEGYGISNGIPHIMDRLKAIGNGQVPAVVATAWELLTERAGF